MANDVILDQLDLRDGREGRVYFRDDRQPSMLAPHRHAEWEFNLVTRGRAGYVVGDRRVELRMDSLFWLLPPQGHVLLEQTPDFRMWIVVARPGPLRRLAEDDAFAAWRPWLRARAGTGGAIPPQHRCVSEATTRHLESLCEALQRGDADDPAQADQETHASMSDAHHAAGLTFLLAEAWRAFTAAEDRPEGTHLHPAIQRAVEWLTDHAHTPAADDLDALAKRCGFSRPHLSRRFAEQTGQSLTEFRNRQRVERFKALVGRGGRYNLTEAAYAAGFGSYAQAFRVIKSQTGAGPRALLDRYRVPKQDADASPNNA